MKAMFMNRYGQSIIKTISEAPRVGDQVAAFYSPPPRVTNVVWVIDEAFRPAEVAKDVEAMVLVA